MLSNKIYNLFAIFFIVISSLFLFFHQIQETNEYMGLEYFTIEALYVIILIDSLILIILFIKIINNNLPSSYLINIYILFVILWNIIFYKSTNILSYELYVFWFILIILPLCSILIFNKLFQLLIDKLFFHINILKFIKLEYLLTLFLIVIIISISFKMPLSFSFNDSYVRRMYGRELIDGINAYIFSMGMNSVAPFLAFYAFLNKKYFYFFISFCFVILCFGFIGSKAPIGYVIFLSLIGYIINKKKLNIFNFFLLIISFIIFLSIIEYFIFNFSIISDIIVRRAFIVVAQNQTYFMDFIINNFTFENWILGFQSDEVITYLIGNLYHYHTDTNANTNAFLYEFVSKGLLGYFGMILFLSFYFSLLNYLYLKYQLKEVVGISIIYSLLLTEQAYTTAFITSGIGFLTILILMTLKANKTKKMEE